MDIYETSMDSLSVTSLGFLDFEEAEEAEAEEDDRVVGTSLRIVFLCRPQQSGSRASETFTDRPQTPLRVGAWHR